MKLRVWNKFHKKMYNVEIISFLHGLVTCRDQEKDTTHEFGMIDCIIMGSSGIKDKNGNEIFKGDVVHYDDFSSVYSTPHTAEVRFRKGVFGTESRYGGNKLIPLHRGEDFYSQKTSILGNIYDNPELKEKCEYSDSYL